jgi:hypothetical protein
VVIGPELPAPVPIFVRRPTTPPDSKGPAFQRRGRIALRSGRRLQNRQWSPRRANPHRNQEPTSSWRLQPAWSLRRCLLQSIVALSGITTALRRLAAGPISLGARQVFSLSGRSRPAAECRLVGCCPSASVFKRQLSGHSNS